MYKHIVLMIKAKLVDIFFNFKTFTIELPI